MARQIVAVALVFFAIISIMSSVNAGEPGPELPTAAELAGAKGHVDVPEIPIPVHAQVPASASSDDIGTTDGNDDAAPVGGPVPAGAFSGSSAQSPSGAPGASAASALEFSTLVGIAATATAAGAAFFF